MSKTAVILVNYQGSEDTAKCVQSLLTCKDLPALVVVDNTPNDLDLDKAIASYPDVHLIRASENIGFGRGNNLGIYWALKQNYRYIFILNNDAQVVQNTIQELEASMENMINVGILAPRIVFSENPEVLWYGGGEVDWRRGGATVPGIFGRADSQLAMKSREVSFVSGCAMFVRREVFIDIGGFDPRFFMYEEDLEFCLRAKEHNYSAMYVPESLVLHKGQGSLRKAGESFVGIWDPKNPRLSFYVFHIVRNRLLNMKLHARGKCSVLFKLGFPIVISWKALLFLRWGAFSGVFAIYRGIKSYYNLRNKKFVNELEMDTKVCREA